MLTQRLKNKDLFEEVNEKKREDARQALNESVRHLILAMATVENIGALSREEVENYVLARMGYYETFFYGMDDDEFDYYLKVELSEQR